MEDKVNNCIKKPFKKIAVFGDSHVEYHGENSSNLVSQLSKKFTSHSLCNFGLSGTDITNYIDRFLYALENKVKMEKAIFYLSGSNDFTDYRYVKIEEIKYNSEKIVDRKLSPIKQFVKSTNALNLIYREIIKKYLFKNRINENFVKELYSDKKYKYFEVSFEDALERMNNTPDKYKKLFSADILNTSFYRLALRNPNYFNENFSPDIKEYEKQKKIAFKHLNFINNLCVQNNIECKIIIIPNDQFLFIEAKKKYSNVFRFNDQKEFGKSKIERDLLKKYDNIFYPENILEYKDYIVNDMHITGRGNKKLARFTYEKIIN